jgi:diguanylate cyclase (GGDEF)-like protein
MSVERILVVDDDATTRLIVGKVLRRDGHEVVEAPSGEQALVAYRQQDFSLVITDVMMEEMSGLDLLKQIRAFDPEALVVIMTSAASLETATAALRLGAYDFLVKPFSDLDLISNVVFRALDKITLLRKNHTLMAQLQSNMQQLEQANRSLQELANHDGLTGLLNSRCFREALEQEISRASRYKHPFSLVFMDLDHFKHYNDTHGHLAGDHLLRELAEILRVNSRSVTVLARYGGEEFVAMVPETGKQGALVYAERLRRKIEENPFEGGNTQPLGKVTISAGVASFPEDGTDSRALIQHADEALYKAKEAGRNRVIVKKSEVADSVTPALSEQSS